MIGKRNVSVCSGHELANALYVLSLKNALTCSYESTIGIEPCKANAFLVTVTGEAMVAFAIDGHLDRHVMTEFLSFLRTFGIRDSLVSLGENTTTRKSFLIQPSYN